VNERKHGVAFVEAMTAFLDERGLAAPDGDIRQRTTSSRLCEPPHP
jgi:hypothetical protein